MPVPLTQYLASFSTPIMTVSPYLSQNINQTVSNWVVWTIPSAITVLRMQAGFDTFSLAGQSPFAKIRLTDGTNNLDLTCSAGTDDTGAVSQNFAAGVTLAINTIAGVGGSGSTSGAHITIQYRMQ